MRQPFGPFFIIRTLCEQASHRLFPSLWTCASRNSSLVPLVAMTVAEIQIQTVNSADVLKSEQDASDVSRASVFVGRDPQVRLRCARDSFFKRLRNILLMPTWCLQPLCSNWGSGKRQALGLTATVQGLSRDTCERSLSSSRVHHQKLQPPHLSLVLQPLQCTARKPCHLQTLQPSSPACHWCAGRPVAALGTSSSPRTASPRVSQLCERSGPPAVLRQGQGIPSGRCVAMAAPP